MVPQQKNLISLAILFAVAAFTGLNFKTFGAFLGGLLLANGAAHFGYGISGFGKMTPKKFFGKERPIHSIWGVYNFILSVILIFNSDLQENILLFVAAIITTFLLLPVVAKKDD